jgi:hypothetical protein
LWMLNGAGNQPVKLGVPDQCGAGKAMHGVSCTAPYK